MNAEIKLNIKDKRILRELFDDGRMPFSKIGKKVGLSKEVVHYRVNNMNDVLSRPKGTEFPVLG